MKRVAINGFGRIGRAFLRLAIERDEDIEIVAINDLMDINSASYLFKYDTAHGRFPREIEAKKDILNVVGNKIKWLSIRDIHELPWKELKIDIVVEATGVFSEFELANEHISSGAKKVVITGPVKKDASGTLKGNTVLVDVNTELADESTIISNASCTTNAVGIPLNILNKTIGIEKAILNTIHAYTASQPIVDSGSKKKNNRIGRAGAQNIIPTTTGAAIATTKVIKELENKFDGIALRVPVISGSIADLTFISKRNTTVEEVNSILKENETNFFTTTEEEVVSSDIIGEPYVSIADLSLTKVVDGNLVKIFLWYDNEEGYTHSLLEQVKRA